MSNHAYENQPTRRRPLTLPLEAIQSCPVIQLFGPDRRVIDRLFRRLAGCNESVATVSIGGCDIQLAVVSGSPTTGRAAVLCINEDATAEVVSDAVEMIQDGPWPAHLVIVSADSYPTMEAEREWRKRLTAAGLEDARIFRVNCDDAMSPELFIKLLLAPTRDAGGEESGIVVSD